jgi:hypothetical protein
MSVGKLTATAAVKIDHFITERKEKKCEEAREEKEKRERRARTKW